MRQLREGKKNHDNSNKFEKNIKIIKIHSSSNKDPETTKCYFLRRRLRSAQPWELVRLENSLIVPNFSQKNKQQIYSSRNNFWSVVKTNKQNIFHMGLQGFIARHDMARCSGYYAFAWKLILHFRTRSSRASNQSCTDSFGSFFLTLKRKQELRKFVIKYL